jgi:hypothetical protein
MGLVHGHLTFRLGAIPPTVGCDDHSCNFTSAFKVVTLNSKWKQHEEITLQWPAGVREAPCSLGS